MRRVLLIIATLPALSACSSLVGPYVYRPTNYTPVPQGNATPTIATLSLDASRRLMIAQLNPQFTCSEPPPDAAVSLLAKAALEATAKPAAGGEAGLNWNDEIAANAASIAKRTAGVEFWRTTTFGYCLVLMNNRNQEASTYLQAAKDIAPSLLADDLDPE